MRREIRIVGGGLAGLTLGLLLRRDGIPTRIFDAGSYPRSKVCGEFISGKGVQILRQLKVVDSKFRAAASSVLFFDGDQSSREVILPDEAIAINRAVLDEQLARAFEREGGMLSENVRWKESFEAEGLVRATGRRLSKGVRGTFVGIKAHARNIALSADLELHFSDRGYVGLSRQMGGRVNVCALFTRERAFTCETTPNRNVSEMFSSQMGHALRERLQEAVFDRATFASVAGISLQRTKSAGVRECRIGDSICMIPPLTGNGMSIALESAMIAAPILREYSRGGIEWNKAQEEVSRQCDRTFDRRLAFAGFLQRVCQRKAGRRLLLVTTRSVPQSFQGWFRLTR